MYVAQLFTILFQTTHSFSILPRSIIYQTANLNQIIPSLSTIKLLISLEIESCRIVLWSKSGERVLAKVDCVAFTGDFKSYAMRLNTNRDLNVSKRSSIYRFSSSSLFNSSISSLLMPDAQACCVGDDCCIRLFFLLVDRTL